ncbi:replication protein A 32 kDa subunit isoform X3 [Tenebrio molitor]|uniref:replication protein A 32 kDa subunit isoform X3 n=1 Tax=Tenebrio molitor TaxID=7067 RepID=UPI0036246F63
MPRTQPVVPLLIEQIHSCKQHEFRMFGKPIQFVCLLGVIHDIRVQFVEVTCYVQDYSGKIKCTMHLDSEAEVSAKISGITENHYAQVFGTVRTENGEKICMIMKMFPVNDLNMVTCHMLQAVCAKLTAEKELKAQLSSANTSGSALADSLTTSDETSAAFTPQLTDFQQLIFNIVKNEDSQCGITRRNVLRQFPSYQGHEVNQVLEYLIDQGIIYCTVDQDHLKALATF